jgi:hypothetical protein
VRQTEGAAAAPVAKEIHRPFAEVFSKIDQKEERPVTSPSAFPMREKRSDDEVHVHGERLPSSSRPPMQTPAGAHAGSLSMLKTNPKKDKGPSAENLSSLRAVLEASLTNKTPKASMGSVSEKKHEPSSQRATPPPVEPKKQVPLLDEEQPPKSPKEVPEDILRGLLSDE